MSRISFLGRSCLAMAVFALASCSSLPNEREEVPRVELPDESWSVRLVPGAHLGSPTLKVEVAADFPWPRRSRGDVSFRVDVLAPEAEWIEGVGRITEVERFSVVGLAPAHLAAELDLTAEEARAQTEHALAVLVELVEAAPAPDDTSLWEIFEPQNRIFPVDGIYRLDERAAWWDTRVRLVPVVAGLAVRGQEAAKAPQRPTFVWGTRGQNLPEPCDDAGTPEDCVRLKAERFRDRICAALDAAQQPRFPQLCARLRATLDPASDPSFEVRCSLPHLFGPGAVTAGLYNPSENKLELSGEDFLGSACAEATLLHEVNHAQEDEADTYPELERFEEMAAELVRIDELGKTALEEGRLDEARRQADRRQALLGTMLPLLPVAGPQRVHSECNCFMLTLDNADLFGYPGDLAWVKETVKSMVFELAEVRSLFFMAVGTPAVRDSLGRCMIRLQAWIDAHPDVKANLEQDLYRAGPPSVSWYQAIDRLRLYYNE